MDALDRGPEDDDVSGMPYDRPGGDLAPAGGTVPAGGAVRVASVVAGDYLLTVNPVDGSEVVLCPPERRPAPERRTPEERAARRRAARPATPGPAARVEHPLLERAEESERLVRLLGRGRSVRVTGPSGVGRSALLAAIADRCAGLAPDGVVHLSGYHRTPADLLYDLYAAVYRAEGHRPDRAHLLELVSGIGAIVVLDDLEFGGAALEELLEAACECAFLIAATPEVAAPAPESPIEEVFLRGLSKEGCLELVQRSVGRPLSEEETAWVSDLWFESEGLPLRFVQAGALLRLRDAPRDDDAVTDADADDYEAEDDDAPFGSPGDVPLPPLAAGVAESLAMRLSTQAREALRVALALGGECVHPSHLPALLGDTGADAALGELIAYGLATTVGSHHRLAAGAQRQLTGEVRRAAEHAKAVAQHYAWWAAHPSITAERVCLEADALFAAMAATRDHGQPSTAVLLARSAAPAFAAALNWSAWERALRIGQEAARQAGEVAEEAYFHHELGVLALCSGNLERARTELEASIGMRGVLADRQGTVVGRRTLALVTDRARGLAPGRAPAAEALPAGRAEGAPGPRIPEIPAERTMVAGITAATPSYASDIAPTVVTRRVEEHPPPARGRGQALTGSRRNLAAATAGALLVAVLGTVVTLGVTSGDGTPHTAPSSAGPGQSAAQDNGTGGLPADQPTDGVAATSRPTPAASGVHGAPAPAASGVTGAGGSPTGGLIPPPVTRTVDPPSTKPSSPPSSPTSTSSSSSPSGSSSSSASANPTTTASASTSGTPVAGTGGSATPSQTPSQSYSTGTTPSGTPSGSGGTVL